MFPCQLRPQYGRNWKYTAKLLISFNSFFCSKWIEVLQDSSNSEVLW